MRVGGAREYRASELPPDVDLAQITLPLEVPVSCPSELAHRRPDILAAEAGLHAATSAWGSRNPTSIRRFN